MANQPTLSNGATGPAVTELQAALAKAGFDPGGIDGVFGANTEAAVRSFQQAHGLEVDAIVGPITWAALEPAGPGQPRGGGNTNDIVAHALWGVDHEPDIHYEQLRPIDGIGHVRQLPLHTDCSGFVTLCYNWAGAPDPNGQGYNGLGYTGTLLNYLDPIDPGDAQPGDLVVIGPGTGDHVVMIVEAGADPMVVGHGSESGPSKGRLSSDGRTPKRFLRSRASPVSLLFGAELDTEQVTLATDLASATNAPSPD